MSHAVAAEQGHRQDQEDEGDGDDDEEVADLQDGALEVADSDGTLDQSGGRPEVGVRAGAVDQRVDLTLLHDRTGIGDVPAFLCDRE